MSNTLKAASNLASELGTENHLSPHNRFLKNQEIINYPLGNLNVPIHKIYLACSILSQAVYDEDPENSEKDNFIDALANSKILNDPSANFQFSVFTNPTEKLKYSTILSKSNQYLFIVFRGTQEFENWAANLNFMSVHLKLENLPTKVHAGFSNSQTLLQPNLVNLIKENPEVKTVIFTGHSLGGAIAQIMSTKFSSWLKQKMPNTRFEVVTFGSPRVGDENFAKIFTRNLKPMPLNSRQNSPNLLTRFGRFVFKDDLVPTLPNLTASMAKSALFSRFGGDATAQNPNQNTFSSNLVNDTQYVHLCNFQRLDDSNNISDTGYNMAVTGSVEDHSIDNYVNKLKSVYL